MKAQTRPAPLTPFQYEPLVRRGLEEDLGRAGDLTSDAIVDLEARATARLISRGAGCIAGLEIAASAFRILDREVQVDFSFRDGDRAEAGETLGNIAGSARALLSAERVALNFLGRLSGIATATAGMVAAVEGYGARIVGTRKTTPGLRALEKYAVRAGGGANHRFGLDDAVLIKDNHLELSGSVSEAVARVRKAVGHMVKVQVEVERLDQLEEALACRVDAVLFDNMSPAKLRQAVEMVDGRLVTEASGGLTPANVREVAASGVDLLSVGWLTHSAPALDVSMEMVTPSSRGD
jgi:nicotinate-nucleotide pyrophosphorylase (carboxylating)